MDHCGARFVILLFDHALQTGWELKLKVLVLFVQRIAAKLAVEVIEPGVDIVIVDSKHC